MNKYYFNGAVSESLTIKENQVKQFWLCLSTKQFNFNYSIFPKAFQNKILQRAMGRHSTAFSKYSLLFQGHCCANEGRGNNKYCHLLCLFSSRNISYQHQEQNSLSQHHVLNVYALWYNNNYLVRPEPN